MAFQTSLLLASFLVRLCQSKCSDGAPIAIPITDVVIESGNSIRGALITLGSPAQNLSWIPQMYLNDTWVYNTSSPSCPRDKSTRWCETYRGGLYNPDGSSTAQAVGDVFAAGASPSDTYRAAGLRVWENAWTLDDLGAGSLTLHDYPIGMPGFDYGTQNHPQGALGLGPNSTILTALKDAGHITSRSYGYWWGEDGATSNAQMDGSLVLGGYDAAKTQGANITIPLRIPSLACMSGMYLTISDIVMRFPNSTRANVVGPRAPLTACLQIDFPSMLSFAREPYYDEFESLSQSASDQSSVGIDWWNPLYDPSSVYQGSLAVVLDNGMELSIPNELLVVPERLIDTSGEVQTNSTYATVLIQPTSGDNSADTPLIGKHFFSSTYLFVDHDAGTFTVWQANSTTDTRLTSVGDECSDVQAHRPAEESPNQNADQHVSEASDEPKTPVKAAEENDSLSTGTIVGIAIGAATAIAATIVLAILLMRRRKRSCSKETLMPGGPTSSDRKSLFEADVSNTDSYSGRYGTPMPELAGIRDVGELDSTTNLSYVDQKPRGPSSGVYELATRTP